MITLLLVVFACIPPPWEGVCDTYVPQDLGGLRPPAQVYQETDGGYLEAMSPDYAEVILDEKGHLYLQCHVLSEATVYVYTPY